MSMNSEVDVGGWIVDDLPPPVRSIRARDARDRKTRKTETAEAKWVDRPPTMPTGYKLTLRERMMQPCQHTQLCYHTKSLSFV